ncbi:MAG: glycosyltransferase family 2 protein [Anaerolineae bacterium]
MTHLTAIVLTYNEAEHIGACLETLTFADERIVFDSYSPDDTCKIARAQGATILQHQFENFASQRNAALDAVADKTDWVLFVDADERVPIALAEEIRLCIKDEQYNGYQIPRHNYIFGKLTTGAGWYPDYQTRLFKVGYAHYENPVHEVVVLDGERGTLTEHFTHYNYKDLDHFHSKQRKYVQYDAQILFNQGIRPRPQNYILQPLRHFRWRFLELEGYRDGWHGLRLSMLMAWYELQKYMTLHQLWQKYNNEA